MLRLQEVSQALVSTEIHKARVAQGLASNPTLWKEAGIYDRTKFCATPPKKNDFSEQTNAQDADCSHKLLFDLMNINTRVVGVFVYFCLRVCFGWSILAADFFMMKTLYVASLHLLAQSSCSLLTLPLP